MPYMAINQSVAANTIVDNVLQGKLYEFLSFNSRVLAVMRAAAVGVFVTLNIGGRVIVDAQEIGAAAGPPIIPDDVIADDFGIAGEKVTLAVHNRTGAAIVVQGKIYVEPV